jgi:hypothetical protein
VTRPNGCTDVNEVRHLGCSRLFTPSIDRWTTLLFFLQLIHSKQNDFIKNRRIFRKLGRRICFLILPPRPNKRTKIRQTISFQPLLSSVTLNKWNLTSVSKSDFQTVFCRFSPLTCAFHRNFFWHFFVQFCLAWLNNKSLLIKNSKFCKSDKKTVKNALEEPDEQKTED